MEDKPAVVVGGGRVAERKARALLKTGADVSVVSPVLTKGLARHVKAGRLKWTPRPVRSNDLRSACIVIAATSDSGINKKVSAWARKRKALVNVVDAPRISSYISPALIAVKGVKVAVYTDGRDPVLSRDLKNFLKERWDVFLSYRNRS